MQIGQRDLAYIRVVKEIVCAGASLEPGTEDHHFHGGSLRKSDLKSPGK
jgi:hypothetical protein